MAVYWVAADGNDANDGLSYANRKATWKAALDTARLAGAGNTVNVVAPSGSPLTVADGAGATLSSLAGTDYDSAPGMRIRGSDSSGTAAHAHIIFADTATNITALSLSSGANKIDLDGLYIDWSVGSTACSAKHFCRTTSTSANGVRMRNCVGVWSTHRQGEVLDTQGTISTDDTTFQYNVFMALGGVAAANPTPWRFDPRGQLTANNNVFILGGICAGNIFPFQLGSNDANLTNHNVSHNTIFFVSDLVLTGSLSPIVSSDDNPFAGTPVKRVKDNVLYWPASTSGRKWMTGNVSADPTKWSIDIGYNQLHIGGSGSWAAFHPYMNPWDPTGTDADDPDASNWTGDNVVVADPFFDIGSTYVWGMAGTGYSIELPYDLRINDPYRETSSTGGVPGAIVDAITAGPDLTIDKVAIGTWQVGVDSQFSLTVRNGGDDTATADIVVTDTLPAGLTYKAASGLGWSVNVVGQLITATWAGDVAASASTDPLTITVEVAQAAYPSVTNTAHVESADDPTGSDDTEIIAVLAAEPEPPGNPSVLLSEQAPGFPVVRTGLRLHRNLELEWNLDGAGETTGIARLWSAIVSLPAGATDVELPMLLSPTALMIETDQDIEIQINDSVQLIRAGGCFLITQTSEVETFAVTNLSAFKTAHLAYCGTGDVTQPSGSVQDPSGGRGDDEELNP